MPLSKLVRLYTEPQLDNPKLIAAWPGIGNVGLVSINYLKNKLGAVEFGEIEPQHFFAPSNVSIENGVLWRMEFPSNKFYYKKGERDLIIFLGEMQPSGEEEMYELANLVLDVGQRFGCQRVYTAGAAVAPIHHSEPSGVWAVPTSRDLIPELKKQEVVLMSEIESRRGQGSITGLNGELLAVAGKRGMEGVCFLGEIPVYISNFPVSYPKASSAILRVLAQDLGVTLDLEEIRRFAEYTEKEIEKVYAALPAEVREQLDRFRTQAESKSTAEGGQITEEDKDKIMKEIDDFFKKGDDQRS